MKFEIGIGGAAGAMVAVWSDFTGWQAIALGAFVALIVGGSVRAISHWRARRAIDG